MNTALLGRRWWASVLCIVGLSVALSVAAPTAAHADGVDTTTTFSTTTAVNAQFGDPWVLSIKVATVQFPTTLMPSSGSIDVFVEGIPGAYASGVLLSAGGVAYFAQPAGVTPLGAGSFNITAVFVPAAGQGINGSQTAVPAVLVIAPLALNAIATIADDPAIAAVPIITASVNGAYVDTEGGAPAGEWSFGVADEDGEEVFSSVVAQEQGATEPLHVSVDSKLAKGTDYTLTSTFTPVESIAGGLTVTQPSTSSFHTTDGTFADTLAAPISTPIWLLSLLGAIFVGLIVAIILFSRKISHGKAGVSHPLIAPPLELVGTRNDVEVTRNFFGEPEAPASGSSSRSTSSSWSLDLDDNATELLPKKPVDDATEILPRQD